jgi:hypothetical protein
MSKERDGNDGEKKLEGKRDATWHCHRELYRTLGPATLHSPHHFILCMRRFSALCCLNFQSWTFQHSPGLHDGPRFLATGGAVSHIQGSCSQRVGPSQETAFSARFRLAWPRHCVSLSWQWGCSRGFRGCRNARVTGRSRRPD